MSMALALRLGADISVFLAGLVVGVIFTIYGSLPLVTADSVLEEVSPWLRLPEVYYFWAIAVLVGVALLLRRAEARFA